jgi:hypothetical protein
MVERLNQLTTAENLAKYKKGKPIPPEQFLKMFATSRHERGFATSFPPGLQAAIGAVLTRNIERKQPLTVAWAWKPSYDFELSLYECEDTSVSKGGITIVMGTRYPLDPHPGTIGKGKASKRKGRRKAR